VTFRFESGSSVIVADVEPGVEKEDVLDAYYGLGLPLALQAAFQYEVVHASAVRITSDRVVGFCGTSEAGKSTIAHGLAQRDHELWADEALAFQTSHGEPVVTLALPFRPKLRPESESFFRRLGGAELRPVTDWSQAVVSMLFVLDPSAAEPKIERLSATDALLSVLPNGYRFRPLDERRERQMILAYLELVASAPIFRVSYERGLDNLPRLLDQIEQTIDSVP
jgi:hypothetical protein